MCVCVSVRVYVCVLVCVCVCVISCMYKYVPSMYTIFVEFHTEFCKIHFTQMNSFMYILITAFAKYAVCAPDDIHIYIHFFPLHVIRGPWSYHI